jgi:hypothetical protein
MCPGNATVCIAGSVSSYGGQPSGIARWIAASDRPVRGIPTPERRKVERPPYDQLLREIAETNYSAVGRKYGVSDNAVRKWVKWYERQHERERKLAEESQNVAEQDPPLAA